MKKILTLVLLMSLLPAISAQRDYKPSESNLEAREWFQDAKFGLFVHWGVFGYGGRWRI
jgi:alpha-L-fucosidase